MLRRRKPRCATEALGVHTKILVVRSTTATVGLVLHITMFRTRKPRCATEALGVHTKILVVRSTTATVGLVLHITMFRTRKPRCATEALGVHAEILVVRLDTDHAELAKGHIGVLFRSRPRYKDHFQRHYVQQLSEPRRPSLRTEPHQAFHSVLRRR